MKKVYALTLLVIVAFILRAGVFLGYLSHDQRYWQVDSATYETLGKELAITGHFSTPDGTPNAYRVPGYPLFLSTIFKVAGINHQAVLWIQIILASVIPLLVYLLAMTLLPWHPRTAWAAAIITTCHLGYTLYAGFMMTETLFVLFFLLFLIPFFKAVLRSNAETIPCAQTTTCTTQQESSRFYNLLTINPAAKSNSFVKFYDELFDSDVAYACCTRNSEQSEGLNIFFAGIMLGIASLIRPVGHYVLAIALIVLFFASSSRLKQILECGLLTTGWFIIVGGWLIRNALLFGQLFFHSLPGGHFLYLSAARVVAAEQNISYQDARAQLRKEVEKSHAQASSEFNRELNEFEICKIHEQLAVKIFWAAPLTSVKFWLQDMFRTTFSLYSAELLYLDSNRQQIDYFATNRPMSNWFMRYLKPATESLLLKGIIWAEIIFHFFLLLGSAVFCKNAFFGKSHRMKKLLWIIIPFITLFIFISLAGGYARMRLPIEFLLIIMACSSVPMFYKKELHDPQKN